MKMNLSIMAAGLLGGALAGAAQTATPEELNVDTIVISATHTVSVKDADFRQALYQHCQEMLNAPAGKYGAHPAAAAFPGPVAAEAPRIAKTVSLSHTPPDAAMLRLITPLDYSDPFGPTMYSTGLYAAPGEVISVDVPAALAGRLEVQIGCQSDNLNEWVAAKENWRRMPLLVNHTALKTGHTRASNPFGGLIYITCPPKTAAWQAAITISNAVMCPQYVAGQTTDKEWEREIATSGAPWGEMGSSNIIIMLPTHVLKKIHDPANRMKLWDKVIGAEMDLAQLPMPFYRAQRLVTDVHIGGGFMHSGYPIMVHHCPEKHMSTEDFISDPAQFALPANGGPNWGFFHEIGHNMQNNDWVFDGTTEVSVNLFSLYCFDKIAGGRDNAHSGVSNDGTQKMLRNFFSDPPKPAKWSGNPFLALTIFRLIQNDFGWDLYKRTFVKYHALTDEQRPKGDAQKRDMFVKYLSETAGADFAPYFATWGIAVSDGVAADLKKYPAWMPYNFPPKT